MGLYIRCSNFDSFKEIYYLIGRRNFSLSLFYSFILCIVEFLEKCGIIILILISDFNEIFLKIITSILGIIIFPIISSYFKKKKKIQLRKNGLKIRKKILKKRGILYKMNLINKDIEEYDKFLKKAENNSIALLEPLFFSLFSYLFLLIILFLGIVLFFSHFLLYGIIFFSVTLLFLLFFIFYRSSEGIVSRGIFKKVFNNLTFFRCLGYNYIPNSTYKKNNFLGVYFFQLAKDLLLFCFLPFIFFFTDSKDKKREEISILFVLLYFFINPTIGKDIVVISKSLNNIIHNKYKIFFKKEEIHFTKEFIWIEGKKGKTYWINNYLESIKQNKDNLFSKTALIGKDFKLEFFSLEFSIIDFFQLEDPDIETQEILDLMERVELDFRGLDTPVRELSEREFFLISFARALIRKNIFICEYDFCNWEEEKKENLLSLLHKFDKVFIFSKKSPPLKFLKKKHKKKILKNNKLEEI